MHIFAAHLGACNALADNTGFGPGPQFDRGRSPADAMNLERRRLEAQLNRPDGATTGTLRLALRRYRSLSRRSSLY
jgi:hypothetical protein